MLLGGCTFLIPRGSDKSNLAIIFAIWRKLTIKLIKISQEEQMSLFRSFIRVFFLVALAQLAMQALAQGPVYVPNPTAIPNLPLGYPPGASAVFLDWGPSCEGGRSVFLVNRSDRVVQVTLGLRSSVFPQGLDYTGILDSRKTLQIGCVPSENKSPPYYIRSAAFVPLPEPSVNNDQSSPMPRLQMGGATAQLIDSPPRDSRRIAIVSSPTGIGPAVVQRNPNSPISPNPFNDAETSVEKVVEVFFATDREGRYDAKRGISFSGQRANGVHLGAALVSIPRGHKMGNLERPRWYRLEFSADREKHFLIERIDVTPEESFFRKIKLASEKSKDQAFIFVHGYNVSFDDAVLRTAQLSVDLDVNAIPVLYSWPSQGNLGSYAIDSQNAEWTESKLLMFLENFAEKSSLKSIVLIAHSMGSRPASRALAKLLEKNPNLGARFTELVLAAPDIDADVFFNDILPTYAKLKKNVTLYASSNDKALITSKKFNGAARAGESLPAPRTATGVEAIDASDVETDFLGHSYIVASRILLTDISLLFGRGMRAAQRPGLSATTSEGVSFWKFRK